MKQAYVTAEGEVRVLQAKRTRPGPSVASRTARCQRPEVDPREFRPYDLEIISELMEGSAVSTATKLGEHFTVSATGVVHVGALGP